MKKIWYKEELQLEPTDDDPTQFVSTIGKVITVYTIELDENDFSLNIEVLDTWEVFIEVDAEEYLTTVYKEDDEELNLIEI